MEPHILSDGTVKNSYGFRVRTSGIDLVRFDANPVMLSEHRNTVGAVLGKWINRTVDGAQLKAEAEFDDQDPDAVKIKGKVERGYIKGASIGISFDPAHMELMPDGVWELTQCELFEASICAIPSNKSALRLYAADSGKLLSEQDVQLHLSALQSDDNFKTPEMKKIALSVAALAALGMNEQPNEDAVASLSAAIESLKQKLDNETKAKEALQAQVDQANQKRATDLVDGALLAGKITADEKASWLDVAKSNYDLAAKTLGALAGKTTLADKVKNEGNAEVKTVDDFEKLPLEKQLAFKAEQPEAYKKLFA